MFNTIISAAFAFGSEYVCTAVLVLIVVLLTANICAQTKKKETAKKVEEPIEAVPDTIVGGDIRYNKSFTAKLILSELNVKLYYTELANYLLAYKRVKQRMSWANSSFNAGREKLVKFAIRGKTLYMYIALDPLAYADTKYYPLDVSSVKKYADVPMRVKVKSNRGVLFAKELIDILAGQLGLERVDNVAPTVFIHDYKDEPIASLIERGLVKVVYVGGKVGDDVACDVNDKKSRSFMEKLIYSDNDNQRYYVAISNYILSFKNVHNRVSNSYSSFNIGRTKLVKLAIRGKTLCMYIALDPNVYIGTKYYPKDVSNIKKYADVPMRVKVKSNRGVLFAKELVSILAKEHDLTQLADAKDTVFESDLVPQNIENLIAKGWIKEQNNRAAN